jgi:hypothetical protein
MPDIDWTQIAHWWVQHWMDIAHWWVPPLVTIIAVFVAYRQVRSNQRETTAKATFREFLKLACEHIPNWRRAATTNF